MSSAHADYMCPEMILGMSRNNPKAIDIWGLGVMLYVMVAGHMPFKVRLPEADEKIA